MPETLIKVENVSKKFCRELRRGLWYGVQDMGNEILGKSKNHYHLRHKEFWAVRDVSFELKRGECLGLIGHNGAGKSTLLKMLNGLIKPDTGRIEMHGRVAALIELGAGFNPILTGRENIYINGTVLGFTKKEIDQKLEAILAFADIGDFIETPVQYYSSGMKVRLGFAVAAQMEPDVLILDEVLAVGDSGFRIKSFNKINEIMSKAAVILVSHSMPTVSMISNQIMLLNKGHIEYLSSNISKGIEKYFETFEGGKATVEYDAHAQIEKITISSIQNQRESALPVIGYTEDIHIDLIIKVNKLFESFNIKIQITDKDLKIVGIYDSDSFTFPIVNDKIQHKIKIKLKQCIFIDGEYSVTTFVSHKNIEEKRIKLLAIYRYVASFKVRSNKILGYVPSVVYLPGELTFSD